MSNEARDYAIRPAKVRLGDACAINYGTRIRSAESNSDAFPVYGGGGRTFGWGSYNREDQCVVSRFAMSPECVRYVPGKFFLNDSGLTVEASRHDVDQGYLNCYLLGHQREIYALGRGCAQKNLKIEDFKGLLISLPTLDEQKKIVEKLNYICELIAKRKEQLAKLNQLVKSRFVEAA